MRSVVFLADSRRNVGVYFSQIYADLHNSSKNISVPPRKTLRASARNIPRVLCVKYCSQILAETWECISRRFTEICSPHPLRSLRLCAKYFPHIHPDHRSSEKNSARLCEKHPPRSLREKSLADFADLRRYFYDFFYVFYVVKFSLRSPLCALCGEKISRRCSQIYCIIFLADLADLRRYIFISIFARFAILPLRTLR
jgi:hypothetical protein